MINFSLVSTTLVNNERQSDNDTTDKFFAGINDTCNNIFPQCCWYRSEITKKPKIYRWCLRHWQLECPAYISLPTPENLKIRKNFIFRCNVHSTKLFTKNEKNYTWKFFSFIADVVDTAEQHPFVANHMQNLPEWLPVAWKFGSIKSPGLHRL